jgi:hypothetical protein
MPQAIIGCRNTMGAGFFQSFIFWGMHTATHSALSKGLWGRRNRSAPAAAKRVRRSMKVLLVTDLSIDLRKSLVTLDFSDF